MRRRTTTAVTADQGAQSARARHYSQESGPAGLAADIRPPAVGTGSGLGGLTAGAGRFFFYLLRGRCRGFEDYNRTCTKPQTDILISTDSCKSTDYVTKGPHGGAERSGPTYSQGLSAAPPTTRPGARRLQQHALASCHHVCPLRHRQQPAARQPVCSPMNVWPLALRPLPPNPLNTGL